jgi:sulfur relay (sulfurtransferase) complex TusBCD TusD component (DsrE family)
MKKKVVVIVRQEGLGNVNPQDRQFGRDMFDRFLHTLEGQALKPHAICFYTEGVKFTCEESPVLFSLRLLERMGVQVVSCTSCLEYYGLESKLLAGEKGTMKDIVQLALEADSVITV